MSGLFAVALGSCAGEPSRRGEAPARDAAEPPRSADDSPFATVLSGARRAVGWTEGHAGPRSGVAFDVSVTRAGPSYEVEVASANDGAVRLRFVDGAAFGVGREGRWVRPAPDSLVALSDTLETFARGHDFFLGLVRPEPRLTRLRFGGAVSFHGQEALLVSGTDAVGGRVDLYYARADTLPLGYEVEDHVRGRGRVTTTLHDWAVTGSVRFPGQVLFTQGEEVFDYAITDARILDPAPDSTFRGRR